MEVSVFDVLGLAQFVRVPSSAQLALYYPYLCDMNFLFARIHLYAVIILY